MSEVSQEDRELIRSELIRLAEFLRKKYDLSIPEIRQILREILTTSV